MKQTTIAAAATPENFVQEFENLLLNMDINGTELLMKKLKFLGVNFDPFAPEVTTECQRIMENLNLTEQFKNPYLATNILLRLLDKTEERINNLKQ